MRTSKDIKFRCWNEKEKKYHENETMYSLRDNKFTSFYGNWTDESHGLVFEEWSGLCDDNGREIYEGDIVYVCGYGNYSVVFPFITLYEALPENDIGSIIGNIHR